MNNEITDLDKYQITLYDKTPPQKAMKFQKDFIPFHISTHTLIGISQISEMLPPRGRSG